MGLLGWLRGRSSGGASARLDEWRQQWQSACRTPDAAAVGTLTASLERLGLPEEDIEIEREMLAGLEYLVELQHALDANGLPVVETGHRVIGSDICHFNITASMPDDEAQPSGHLFFTPTRVIFAGGARSRTMPWHTIGEVLQHDRDLILVRNDRETFSRFRCNVYADALAGALLARRLSNGARRGRSV
jgi:hypothetical protein